MIIEYLTAILIFVTAIYVFLTHKMAVATEASVNAVREQTEALSRPYMVFEPYVRPNTPCLYLRIKNTGKTSAKNLVIKLDQDFFQFEKADRNIRDMPAFNEKIQSFSPGAEILFGLAEGWIIFGENADSTKTPSNFTITANYEFSGKKVEEIHYIDLRPFSNSEGEKDPIAEELEKIRKQLGKKP